MREEMSEEQYLGEQIKLLQQSYEKAAKPFVDRLIYLRSIELSRTIFIPKEAAHEIKGDA